MKSNKGFTLIELLAVIVILAIIALIATPLVLNIINRAREGADQASAYAIIDSVEREIAMTMLSNPTYKVTGNITTLPVNLKNGNAKGASIVLTVNDSGLVDSGTISFTDGNVFHIADDGTVTLTSAS